MAATTLHGDHVIISDEQFSKLVELLTPGYECSKLMLAELQARAPQPANLPVEDWKPTGEKPWSDGDTLAAPAHPDQSGEPKKTTDDLTLGA